MFVCLFVVVVCLCVVCFYFAFVCFCVFWFLLFLLFSGGCLLKQQKLFTKTGVWGGGVYVLMPEM